MVNNIYSEKVSVDLNSSQQVQPYVNKEDNAEQSRH